MALVTASCLILCQISVFIGIIEPTGVEGGAMIAVRNTVSTFRITATISLETLTVLRAVIILLLVSYMVSWMGMSLLVLTIGSLYLGTLVVLILIGLSLLNHVVYWKQVSF